MWAYPVLKGGKELTAKAEVSPSQSGTAPKASDCLQLLSPRERVPGCQPQPQQQQPTPRQARTWAGKTKSQSLIIPLSLSSQSELRHDSAPDLSPKHREKGCRKINSYLLLSPVGHSIDSSTRGKARRHSYLAQGALDANYCAEGVRQACAPLLSTWVQPDVCPSPAGQSQSYLIHKPPPSECKVWPAWETQTCFFAQAALHLPASSLVSDNIPESSRISQIYTHWLNLRVRVLQSTS